MKRVIIAAATKKYGPAQDWEALKGTPLTKEELIQYADEIDELRNRREHNLYSKYPEDIEWAIRELKFWIVKEKLGGASTLEEASEYLLNRTVRNKRSGRTDPTEIYNLIDWAEQEGLSAQNLVQEVRSITSQEGMIEKSWKADSIKLNELCELNGVPHIYGYLTSRR